MRCLSQLKSICVMGNIHVIKFMNSAPIMTLLCTGCQKSEASWWRLKYCSTWNRSLTPCKRCRHTNETYSHTNTCQRHLPTQAPHKWVSPSSFPGQVKPLQKTALSPSVKQIRSPYKGVHKNPHDQSVWEWQPCPGLAIIRPHECLSSPLLSVEALTVTHPAMTVTPAQRASRRQGPTTSNEAVKGPCSWTVATNTSWSSPTAQQQTPTAVLSATASTEKRCTARTSFPSLPPFSLSLSVK